MSRHDVMLGGTGCECWAVQGMNHNLCCPAACPLIMSRRHSRLSAVLIAFASGLSEPVGALVTLLVFQNVVTQVLPPSGYVSQNVLIRWFAKVNSPTKSSTYCFN